MKIRTLLVTALSLTLSSLADVQEEWSKTSQELAKRQKLLDRLSQLSAKGE